MLRAFFDDPDPEGEGLNLRAISRRADLSHTSVKKHLETLEEEGLIETREVRAGGKSYPVYLASRENERYKHYKSVDMISRIRESGLLQKLIEDAMPDCIVLFGSAARGEDVKNSDIDLYLQCEEKELDLTKFEDSLKRNIQLHFKPDFVTYSKELKNNIINGTVLHGYLTGYGE